MSVTRNLNLSNRKDRRDSLSSPYKQTGRPSTQREPETKPWSIFGVFSFIASLGFGTTKAEGDIENHQDDDNMNITEPATAMTTNVTADAGRPASSIPMGGPVPLAPPPRQTTNQPVASSSGVPPSSSDFPVLGSIDTSIIEWMELKKENQTPVNEMEILGLKSYFNQRERTYEPERLRFGSHAPSTPTSSPVNDSALPTPAASRQPAFSGSTSLPTFTNNAPSARASNPPKRMLRKDPNGTIVWKGAGRARSTPVQDRRRPPPPDIPKRDTSKRRKIFEESSGPGIAPGMSTSQSAPISESSSAEAGPSTPPRLARASIIRPRTAPIVSSPLRNVVNNSPPASPPNKTRTSSSSTNTNANTSANTSQTFTATFLAEVIERATPRPKVPDVANPYQTASLVKPEYKPMEKKRMCERRARNKGVEKEKEMAKVNEVEKKEPSAKDIIEATVPKGAKRSRPPPGLNKSKAASTDAPEAATKPIVEEPTEESMPKKKSRKVTIEEVDDDDVGVSHTSYYVRPAEIIEPQEPASGPVRPPSTVPSNHFGPSLNPKAPTFSAGKSSLPKEPSKLRTSFLPDEDENETPKAATPIPACTSGMTTASTPLAQVQEKEDPKEIALALPLSELPVFIFKAPSAPVLLDHAEAGVAAKALPLSALPTFDFSKSMKSTSSAAPSSVPTQTMKAFDFVAAGLKPVTPANDGSWQCSSCTLRNPASALEKCLICDAPRPGAEKAKASANGTGPASTPAPAVKAFDFAAAGLKPAAPANDGSWQCSSCTLRNPASALEKCLICDAPRPRAEKAKAPTNGTGLASTPAPAVKAFDFAAAGLKPAAPLSGGNWQCSSCMLQNPASVLEKCTICDAPRLGVQKKVASVPVPKAMPTPPAAPKPFDWAAAGMVPQPKSRGDSWTCGTCMLSNPPTATEKCSICDARRS